MFDLINGSRIFNFNDTYDYLHNLVGVSTEALDLAFSLNGQNIETATNILFYYTGWDDFDAYSKDLQEM